MQCRNDPRLKQPTRPFTCNSTCLIPRKTCFKRGLGLRTQSKHLGWAEPPGTTSPIFQVCFQKSQACLLLVRVAQLPHEAFLARSHPCTFTHAGRLLKGCVKKWILSQKRGRSPLTSLAAELLRGVAAATLTGFGQLQSAFFPYVPHCAHLWHVGKSLDHSNVTDSQVQTDTLGEPSTFGEEER